MATRTRTPKPDPVAPKPEDEREPILEISVLAPERPFAVVDDVPHEFRLVQEFGSTEHQNWSRDSRRYDELYNSEKRLTRAQEVQRDRLLDRLFDQVMVDAKALRDQLGPERRDEHGHVLGLTGTIQRQFVLTFSNAPSLMDAQKRLKELRKAAAQMEEETEAEDSSTTES